MRKAFAALILAFGLFSAPSAMAVHTCGQLLGSCLPELDPTPTPVPTPVPPAPVPIPVPAPQPVPTD